MRKVRKVEGAKFKPPNASATADAIFDPFYFIRFAYFIAHPMDVPCLFFHALVKEFGWNDV